jgi:hypothetical protein
MIASGTTVRTSSRPARRALAEIGGMTAAALAVRRVGDGVGVVGALVAAVDVDVAVAVVGAALLAAALAGDAPVDRGAATDELVRPPWLWLQAATDTATINATTGRPTRATAPSCLPEVRPHLPAPPACPGFLVRGPW